MSSKKYRKRLRSKRIVALKPHAAKIFFNKESDEIYSNNLKEMPEDLTIDQISIYTRAAYYAWFGRAYSNWLSWHMGDRSNKLNFIISRKGKIHARDIHAFRAGINGKA